MSVRHQPSSTGDDNGVTRSLSILKEYAHDDIPGYHDTAHTTGLFVQVRIFVGQNVTVT